MINIIYEDEQVAVINKPAEMPTLQRACHPREETVSQCRGGALSPPNNAIECILWPAQRPATTLRHSLESGRSVAHIIKNKWPNAEPVHRLDNDTSGLLLVAKTKESFTALRKQFDERTVLKQYTALVLGEPRPEGVIETPIIHDPRNKKKMKTGPAGQPAWTSFQVVKKFLAGRYSLLEISIKTGVRHQIRVHLASMGHPIAGDKLYRNVRQSSRDETKLSRQFLHASKIGFNDPSSGKWIEFKCPLPADLRGVLKALEGVIL